MPFWAPVAGFYLFFAYWAVLSRVKERPKGSSAVLVAGFVIAAGGFFLWGALRGA